MATPHPTKIAIDFRRGLPEGLEMFDVIEDPRSGNATRHPFGSILFIALCALLCGMNTCEDFVRFAKAREEWLRKWISLPNGIPCANTFLRVFAAIDPVAFTECLAAFVTRICPELAGRLVAIDGKTLRGSRKADESTVQILSAWACHNGITLSQRAVDHKSNEITAVPKLLRHLNLKGAIVSIDAMGTQLKIAIAIIQAGADYLLALKANQGTLHDDVREFFADPANLEYAREKGGIVHTIEHHDKGHGRIEKRVCTVTDWLDWLPASVRRSWLGLRSIVRIESRTTLAGGKVREEVRHYISSLAPDAAQHLELSRAHWGIENSCHWVLDVVFREDEARARCGDAAQNLSTLRRIALNLLKTETTKPKEPIRGKRIYAALDPSYLEAIIGLRQM
jgi:predicted transposase YbfD/YdcC